MIAFLRGRTRRSSRQRAAASCIWERKDEGSFEDERKHTRRVCVRDRKMESKGGRKEGGGRARRGGRHEKQHTQHHSLIEDSIVHCVRLVRPVSLQKERPRTAQKLRCRTEVHKVLRCCNIRNRQVQSEGDVREHDKVDVRPMRRKEEHRPGLVAPLRKRTYALYSDVIDDDATVPDER